MSPVPVKCSEAETGGFYVWERNDATDYIIVK